MTVSVSSRSARLPRKSPPSSPVSSGFSRFPPPAPWLRPYSYTYSYTRISTCGTHESGEVSVPRKTCPPQNCCHRVGDSCPSARRHVQMPVGHADRLFDRERKPRGQVSLRKWRLQCVLGVNQNRHGDGGQEFRRVDKVQSPKHRSSPPIISRSAGLQAPTLSGFVPMLLAYAAALCNTPGQLATHRMVGRTRNEA